MFHKLSNYYLGVFLPATTLIPIVAGYIYRKRINKPLLTLQIYLVLALVTNVVASVMASYGINNMPLLHFYTIFETVAILIYYREAFSSKPINKWIMIIMILFPLLCVVNLTFFQSIYRYNTYTRPVGALIVIIFSGVYLAVQNNLKRPELITTSGRLVASGFIVYYCSSLFQFIFSNIVSHFADKDVKMLIWVLHATFVLIMYLFFLKAILDERSKR